MPQIEVTFDIDANGILHVSAKDKATGKQQTIQIKASSGLNEDEIKRMVKDAEEHKDQDRKFHELVDARNKADALIHATEKSLKDVGDKISSDDKSNIEKAVADLKAAIKGADKAEIDTKTEALNKASAKMAEQLYAKQGAAGAPGGETGAGGGEAGGGAAGGETGGEKKGGENVVDAEFEEVKEDKDKDKK
jgi:molecular chaperone DnaK